MGKFIQNKVNIYEYPEEIAILKQGSIVVLGDLHANAVKLVFFLVREGILSVTRDQYNRLVEIYRILVDGITAQLLQEFDQLVAGFNINKNKPLPNICFIGDELTDRGSNDYFILKIFEKLCQENVPFYILLSNHGVQFLKQYRIGLDKYNQTFYSNNNRPYGVSLHNLQTLLQDKLKVRDINAIVKQHYLSKLKLLDYAMQDENTILLFTHAPVSEIRLRRLADLFGIPFSGIITTQDIVQMIDKVNQIFLLLCDAPIDLGKPDQLKKLADLVGVPYDNQNTTIQEINEFFKFKINIRNENFLRNLDSPGEIERLVNDRYNDLDNNITSSITCNIINIHGHVCEEEFPWHMQTTWQYINLDGLLGIGMTKDSHIGLYNVYTDNVEYRPAVNCEVKEITVSITKVSIFPADIKTDATLQYNQLSSLGSFF